MLLCEQAEPQQVFILLTILRFTIQEIQKVLLSLVFMLGRFCICTFHGSNTEFEMPPYLEVLIAR